MKFRKVRLCDLCSIVTDYVANGSFKTLADKVKYLNEGYARVIRLVDYNNKYSKKDSIWVSKEAYEFLKKSKLYGGEIVLTNVGANLGTVFIAPQLEYPTTLGPNAIMIKTNENDKYLYYWLKSKNGQNTIKSIVTGSAMPKFNKTDLKNIEIAIPCIEDQGKIVEILSKIDKKIELNNKTNDNLFEMSVKLFNNFLNNNKDIENVKLKECVERINTGADAIQRAPIVEYDTGIRCIRIGDMTNNRPYHCWGFTKMTEKDFANYQLLKNDIVITRTAVNGLTYMITDEKNVVCNNGNIRLRVNKKFNPLYIYLYTKTKEFRNYIDRINSETSVRPNMKVEYLTDFSIKNLSLDNQNKICQIIQPLMTKIHKNITENHTLEQMRDTLLPKLMNGEIDLDKIEI